MTYRSGATRAFQYVGLSALLAIVTYSMRLAAAPAAMRAPAPA